MSLFSYRRLTHPNQQLFFINLIISATFLVLTEVEIDPLKATAVQIQPNSTLSNSCSDST